MELKLYQIVAELRLAETAMLDMGMDELTVRDTLESLAEPFEIKATGCAATIKNIEVYARAKKARGQELIDEAKMIEKRMEWLKEYLLTNMQAARIEKIDSPYFSISLQNNPPSVVIDHEGIIPVEFFNYPEAPPPSPNKKLIGEAIKAGVDVPGVHLAQYQRLVIK